MTRYQLTPVLLVGLEGLRGTIMLAVLLPLLAMTPHPTFSNDGTEIGDQSAGSTFLATVFYESTRDTFLKMSHSSALIALVLSYMFAVWAYNIASNVVTKKFNAVVRSIFEACRVLGVWVIDLVFFYVVRWRGYVACHALPRQHERGQCAPVCYLPHSLT